MFVCNADQKLILLSEFERAMSRVGHKQPTGTAAAPPPPTILPHQHHL